MDKENGNKKAGGVKSVISLVLLVAILLAIFFLAPKLQNFFDDRSSDEAADIPEKVSTEEVKSEPSQSGPQAPSNLKAWVPLVEKQFPKNDDTKFRLLHLRLSEDSSKLLLDLEIIASEQDDNERFDLILERDEFGRYISDNDELPMKLYPPEELQEKELEDEE